MSEIKLNQEFISALQNCKDAKSIIALAKSKGIELGEEKAEKIFAMLQNDKLTDEKLEKIVGGNCVNMKGQESNPGYEKGTLQIPID